MTDPTQAKSPRWMRLVLFGSLALNLLIVGLAVGALLRGPHDSHRQPDRAPTMPGDLRSLARAMPDPARQVLRDAIEKRPAMSGARRREIRKNRERFLEALTAEPFEIAAIEAIFDAQHAAFSATAQDGQAALLEAIASMTDAERATFVENLRKAKPLRKR